MRSNPSFRTTHPAARPAPGFAPWIVAVLAATLLIPAAQAQRGHRPGTEVVEATCAKCHATGENNAPRIGDVQAWAPRAAQGLTALTEHAMQGIRNMPAHGGNPGLSDIEIERAITVMVNRSGGNWIEPLGGATPAAVRSSAAIVSAACAKCHREGLNGAPRIGDREAWIPRLKKGLPALVQSAVHGHGAMPARGGVADLGDHEIEGAVVYMFNFGVAMPTPAPAATRTAADSHHRVVDGADVYFGIVPADAIPKDQRRAKAPSGKGYYHVNISLFDSATRTAITDAEVKVRVSDPVGAETRVLDIVSANNTISYGGYFRLTGRNPYTITAQIQRPGAPNVAVAKFEYTVR